MGARFETYEVDLENKSEEFLNISPTGKVLVVVADGGYLYRSNVANQYLDEVLDSPKPLPEDPKEWAYARIWMASGNTDFFPAVLVAGGRRVSGRYCPSRERFASASRTIAAVG
jgi:glutathione S-transferase